MDKSAFIKINETRIKLSNIKNYGISRKHIADNRPIGEYHRRIWFCDYASRAFNPIWEAGTSLREYDVFASRDKDESFLDIDDFSAWKSFIDMDTLKNEYQKVKAIAVQRDNEKQLHNKKQNRLTAIFKNNLAEVGRIGEVLSEQEAVVPFYETDRDYVDEPELGLYSNTSLVSTKGKLYFDGNTLRCEGSPFKGAKTVKEKDDVVGPPDIHGNTHFYKEVECTKICLQYRVCNDIDELINNGELERVDYGLTHDCVTTRYLYITTYQNDNFQFTENECDIDDVLKKLDNNLSIQ